MSLKECYEKMGADYEDVLSRLRSEGLVRKFAVKFLDDDSYAALKDAMAAGNALEAFRGAHTLKGVAQNLGFGPLYKAAAQVTEVLRPSENSSGDMEKAAELMPAVDEEYARTIAAIKELYNLQVYRKPDCKGRSKVWCAGHFNGATTETEDLFY